MSFASYLPPNQIPFTPNNINTFCFSCHIPYSFRQTSPLALPCGHTLCQICFAVYQKCPRLCSNGPQTPQNSPPNHQVKFCKIHKKPIEFFCVQDEQFLCSICSITNHQKHKTLPLGEIQPKTNKLDSNFKQITQKKTLQKAHLTKFLEEQRLNSKWQIAEIIDQKISSLELLKKKQHKEADIALLTQQNHFEHQLAQEQISKYYEAKALTIEAWRRKPEEALAVDIIETSLDVDHDLANFDIWTNSLQAEALQQQEQSSVQAQMSLEAIKTPKNLFNELFVPAFPTQKIYPKVERDYLISVLEGFGLHGCELIGTGFLEITAQDPVKHLIPKFLPESFNCSMQKLSLKCGSDLLSTSFTTLCKVLEKVNELEDLTIQFQQKITDEALASLSQLVLNQKKTLKRLSVSMDLISVSNDGLRKFGQSLAALTGLLSLAVGHKGSDTLLSFQRVPSEDQKSLQNLEELSLKFNEKNSPMAESLSHFFACEDITKNQGLQVFKIALAKEFQSLHLLKSLSSFLHDQESLEEIEFEHECEIKAEISSLLAAILNTIMISDSLKKLNLTIGARYSYFFLLKSLDAIPRLEEFQLNFKCTKNSQENQILQGITKQLSSSRNLTRLAMNFHAAKFSHSIIKSFLTETQKLKTLASLDIEFLDVLGLKPEEEENLRNILQQFPCSLPGKRLVRTPKMITSRVKQPPIVVLDE